MEDPLLPLPLFKMSLWEGCVSFFVFSFCYL